jgi:NarL family two-component system response regulator YdfI
MEQITVLIADDHTLFREGLVMLLSQQDDIKVVGEAEDGLQTLSMTEALQPDILLLDIRMPKLSGLEVLAKIRLNSPRTRTLILSGFFEDKLITDAFHHGAKGYVLKTARQEELIKAIQTTYAGELWAERKVLTQVVDSMLQRMEGLKTPPSALRENLTEREHEVAKWVIQGMTNKEIASQLGISERTVKAHLYNIFSKLKVSRRLQLLLHQIAERTE